MVRKAACEKLHPNPDDEFCNPAIGLNDEIIAKYHNQIRIAQKRGMYAISEPLTVEKMYPDGYIILNGHHRWAAAIRMGMPEVPIEIVNLTQAADVQRMIRKAKHDKRVTLDLDEVVFLSDQKAPAEKKLPFPLGMFYPERLRLGIPALFHFLKTNGYDIWVYSANYRSMDHIRHYFLFHHIRLDGIVTGTARKREGFEAERTAVRDLLSKKYVSTLHIDQQSLLVINDRIRQYEEHTLSGHADSWSWEIMEIVGAFEKHEE
ncbi:MAG: ParB N-terminal domain-containing protein [Clostridia bacterium]|nr:ParB N-terminal domain-containing protein [Clostridia bacterium]